MNDTTTMNRGAIAASRLLDEILSLPGTIVRAPGKAIRRTQSGLYRFVTDFRTLRAEVRKAKREGQARVTRALQQLEEVRTESSIALRDAVGLAEQNVRDAQAVVERTRTAANRQIKLATERMKGTKQLRRMEKEAAQLRASIAAYEQRVYELERLVGGAAAASVAEPQVTEVPITAMQPEVYDIPAEEEEEAPAGMGDILEEHGQVPAHAAETSELADAGEPPVPAGVALADPGADDKL
jgi:hypothetical protein